MIPIICPARRGNPETYLKRQFIPDIAHDAITSVNFQNSISGKLFLDPLILGAESINPTNEPKIQFRKVLVNFRLLPCDTNQEPSRNRSETKKTCPDDRFLIWDFLVSNPKQQSRKIAYHLGAWECRTLVLSNRNSQIAATSQFADSARKVSPQSHRQ